MTKCKRKNLKEIKSVICTQYKIKINNSLTLHDKRDFKLSVIGIVNCES